MSSSPLSRCEEVCLVESSSSRPDDRVRYASKDLDRPLDAQSTRWYHVINDRKRATPFARQDTLRAEARWGKREESGNNAA